MFTTVTPPPAVPSLHCLLIRQVLRHEAQPAAHHMPVRQDLFHHAAHQIDGNRKADAFGSAVGTIEHRGVDAHQIAVCIDERAAGISQIDRGVRLNEVLECGEAQLTAPGGADDALRDGLTQAIGVADGEHDIAHPQGVRPAQGHDGHIADLKIEDGNIRVGVLSDDGGIRDSPVGELDSDRIGARDDMLVRDDGSHRIHDHA